MKIFKVRAHPSVARLAAGHGTRRRSGIAFSGTAVYLERLTPEIESDEMLVKSEVTAAEMKAAHGTLSVLPEIEAAPASAESAPPPANVATVATAEDLAALSYQQLKKLAAHLELDHGGKKEDLIARIGEAKPLASALQDLGE